MYIICISLFCRPIYTTLWITLAAEPFQSVFDSVNPGRQIAGLANGDMLYSQVITCSKYAISNHTHFKHHALSISISIYKYIILKSRFCPVYQENFLLIKYNTNEI